MPPNGAVRLAASVYLKSIVKFGWIDDVRLRFYRLYF